MESISYIQNCFLVREAQGGDHAAFERLVRAHDQDVLKLALRITGSESEAQDIHQETFLRVYKNLPRFRFECSFSTWIYRIATNVCMDHLRRNRNRREDCATDVNVEGEEYDVLNQVSDDRPANNPEQELLRREMGAHILSALERLSPRERMVFELKHFQGLKVRTVSEILNASEGSIKTSLFRATRKLRFRLAGYTRRRGFRERKAAITNVE
jgi:RNA polymerase sigma-70 factor, ECF subfamily